MKILITGAASTAAYQLKSKLNSAEVILGDYQELPQLMIRNGSMIVLPDPAYGSYAHKMLALGLDNDITTIYALHPTEFELLREAELLFGEYGITILSGNDAV
ncbi:hypothetical protein [Mucilaginibacter myungsuensis]|uniref:Uncharacterized protein n=1 Tax=Mucilaginibacter myungsuensis TaxID=649104 RepID=A0A929KXW4_9SPHI|nr:hypothetical protein [Mucilaginibacter myungsuensis]MBE9663686.1 hypothetical protein [Mucilaginibacter myungsuensis]MDN3598990.1 hypothetical protein [Mucilaginibacter myungsuensis]